MNSQHTEGEWFVDTFVKTWIMCRKPSGREIYLATLTDEDDERHLFEGWRNKREANARLMAAAPTLLTTLKRLADASRNNTGGINGEIRALEAEEMAFDLINKLNER